MTFLFVQKLYVPVVDTIITFSMLWFFYTQGMRARRDDVSTRIRKNRKTARKLEKNPNYFEERNMSVDTEVRVI